MANRTILDSTRKEQYLTPPNYSPSTLDAFFELTPRAMEHCRRQNTPRSRLAFILAYSYCKTEGRFYSNRVYHDDMVIAAINRFGHLSRLKSHCTKTKLNVLKKELQVYSERHRDIIIVLLGRQEVGTRELKQLNNLAKGLAEKQTGPEVLFDTLIDRCISRNWLLPNFNELSNIINYHHDEVKNRLLQQIDKSFSSKDCKNILAILEKDHDLFLGKLKRIEQSRKTRAFQSSSRLLEALTEFHQSFLDQFNSLKLNDKAIAYYARWVQSNEIKSLSQLRDKRDRVLRLMAFVAYNVQERQDAILNSLIANIRGDRRKYRELARERFFSNNSEELLLLSQSAGDSRQLVVMLEDIQSILNDPHLTLAHRVQIANNKISEILQDNVDDVLNRADQLDDLSTSVNTDKPMYQVMLDSISALVKKYTPAIRALIFDPLNECSDLYQEIMQFQNKKTLSANFLPSNKRLIWQAHDKNEDLLKFMLLEEVTRNVNAGKLSLLYSFNYRQIERYFIEIDHFMKHGKAILESCDLYKYSDFETFKKQRSRSLDLQYKNINAFLTHPENRFLRPSRKGRATIRQPQKGPIIYDKIISELLYDVGTIPIIDILNDINEATDLFSHFHHSTHKHASRHISPHILQAAIISQGCNIGTRNLFERSSGLKENALFNAVRFRLSKENLKQANDSLLKCIECLPLSRVFQQLENKLHSSSDGQKWMVKHDSLLAQRSFKYFGQESGVTRYAYVDEKTAFCQLEYLCLPSVIRPIYWMGSQITSVISLESIPPIPMVFQNPFLPLLLYVVLSFAHA